MFKIYEKYLRRSSTLVNEKLNFNEKLNSFAGIFWLVLAQLQNQFFAEHLPVAAYERCLKEKEWKKQSSVFIVLSLTFFFVALQLSVGEIRTNYEHFSPKNENKIRKTSLKQNLLVLMKKKECIYLLFNWFSVGNYFVFTYSLHKGRQTSTD